MPQSVASPLAPGLAKARCFSGTRGDYVIVDNPFRRDNNISAIYIDAKYQFRFSAQLLDTAYGLDVQLSRLVLHAASLDECIIEDSDLAYVEENLAHYFLEEDASSWRGAILAATMPASIHFGWRLRLTAGAHC